MNFDAWIIGVHLVTAHFPAAYDGVHRFEWLTPGLYVVAPGGATVGAYRNSYGNASAYAGWTWRRGQWALMVGAVTGYDRASVLPMVVPSYSFKLEDNKALRFSYMPKTYKAGAHALHVSYEFQL